MGIGELYRWVSREYARVVLAVSADADGAFPEAEQLARAASAVLLYLELELHGLHHALQVVHAGLEVVSPLGVLCVFRLLACEQLRDELASPLVLEVGSPATSLLYFRLVSRVYRDGQQVEAEPEVLGLVVFGSSHQRFVQLETLVDRGESPSVQ